MFGLIRNAKEFSSEKMGTMLTWYGFTKCTLEDQVVPRWQVTLTPAGDIDEDCGQPKESYWCKAFADHPGYDGTADAC